MADIAWWLLLNTASSLRGLPGGGANERKETPALTAALSTVPEKMVDHRTCAGSMSYVIWSTSSQYQIQSQRASQRQSQLRGRRAGLASAPFHSAWRDGRPESLRVVYGICHVVC